MFKILKDGVFVGYTEEVGEDLPGVEYIEIQESEMTMGVSEDCIAFRIMVFQGILSQMAVPSQDYLELLRYKETGEIPDSSTPVPTGRNLYNAIGETEYNQPLQTIIQKLHQYTVAYVAEKDRWEVVM